MKSSQVRVSGTAVGMSCRDFPSAIITEGLGEQVGERGKKADAGDVYMRGSPSALFSAFWSACRSAVLSAVLSACLFTHRLYLLCMHLERA